MISPDSADAFSLHRVAKVYGRAAALRAVTLHLAPGRTMVLLGPNGSGKTTLLKILGGALLPTLGGGAVYGHDLTRDRAAVRALAGLMAVRTYLYDDLTARENLDFVAAVAGKPSGGIPALLERVDLAPVAETRVRFFSSGMQRRLALARVMLLRPRLLLLDEPYNSLDAAGVDLVNAAVREAVAEGAAAVLATHDVERGLALADEVAVLEHGAVVFAGTPDAMRPEQVPHVV